MGDDRQPRVWQNRWRVQAVIRMRIQQSNLSTLCADILRASGVDDAQTETVTENLIWCDMVGRRNHGVERLPILLDHVAAKTIHCPCAPRFESLSESMQRLDADQAFGHHAGRLATDRACDLAREQGVGIVGVTNSNFFGAGAYYANRAAEQGMVSLVLSNSFPKVAAPGGIRAFLGTNPFAFGAPRREGRALLVDMSTGSVAGSTVREKAAKGEQFPDGVAIDADGQPIHDPHQVLKGTLLPAAGAKGFGIALLVEVLSAVLTGAAISKQVGSMYKQLDRPGNNGHFVMALDISRWMPVAEFFDRMDMLTLMASESGPDGAVRLPGEARWAMYEESLAHGIAVETKTRERLTRFAQDLKLEVPWA